MNVNSSKNFEEVANEFIIKDETELSDVLLFVVALNPCIHENLNTLNSSTFLVEPFHLFIQNTEPKVLGFFYGEIFKPRWLFILTIIR